MIETKQEYYSVNWANLLIVVFAIAKAEITAAAMMAESKTGARMEQKMHVREN